MTLADYTKLIRRYAAGELDQRSLHDAVMHLLADDSKLTLTDLLSATQTLLQNGDIDPKNFRQVAELITELNIRQVMSLQKPKGKNGGNDETLIMRHVPGKAIDDETLIMPQPPAPPQTISADMPGRQTADKPRKKSGLSANPVKVGDILKNRFELVEVLGHGGMGVVYKARDLVKVKARDSNPYVAIKVLSDAFKKHSRAFIALQREASKSQRLAHPNIATVYDFDHDGSTIYMTMELLHGQPFDTVINQLPQGGLPKEIALKYIEELCSGLAYAHKQNLIHCDLKPANIFLCNNGTVKLLDFGITRAIKDEQKEGEDQTLFDPATLKALTPAYASVEMFRGDIPDKRDDIYALACVSYELLTGVHPYKKVAAHKALELDLKPQPVKGLSRPQQKALFQALALERGKRTATVEEFLSGVRKPKSHAKQLAIGAALFLAVIGLLVIKPIQTHLREEAKLQTVQTIKDGDQQKLIELLSSIQTLDSESREYYKFRLRKEIIQYYEDRINTVKNADMKRYDYPEAIRLLNEVKQLYTDSAQLKEAERKLYANRNNLIAILVEKHQKLSAQNKDTRRVLEILKEADPDNPLLRGETP